MWKQFCVKPAIHQFDTAKDFCEKFHIGEGDLLFVSEHTYQKFFAEGTTGATVVHYRKYGKGEPTDLMVEGICQDLKDVSYQRVIAVGGGTILDVAKLFALKQVSPVGELFEKKLPIEKEKKLVLVPTTCGTGSEVTNISILELTQKGTKLGLAAEELYADDAVLIPELLSDLPASVFATSSIDALIHSIESFTSPKASAFSRLYSKKAMSIILETYQKLETEGMDQRKKYMEQMLLASTYAGIAFGNAGCAAVHAMSYPLGAKYHVPHGEANYAMFTGVYYAYLELDPDGGIQELNQILASFLGCETKDVYQELDHLLGFLIPKKALREYGVTKEDIDTFTDVVMTKQGRLMANNYTELTREKVAEIYRSLYA